MIYLLEFRCDNCHDRFYKQINELTVEAAEYTENHNGHKAGVGHYRCGMYRFEKVWIEFNAKVVVGGI